MASAVFASNDSDNLHPDPSLLHIHDNHNDVKK